MIFYIYQSEILCEKCGKLICGEINHDGFAPKDVDDELTYDSDDYPKGPYLSEDNVEYCAYCGPQDRS